MKKIKQGVKVNDTESPFLFNILSNDLSFFINEAKLENFADDKYDLRSEKGLWRLKRKGN